MELFAEQGYGATSIPDICTRAGLTKGAFYSNFANKDALFLALLDRSWERRAAWLRRAMSAGGGLVVAPGRRSSVPGLVVDRRWTLVSVEFSLHAIRRPDVARLLVEHERRVRAELAVLVTESLESAGRVPTLPVDELARMVVAVSEGSDIQALTDAAAAAEAHADLGPRRDDRLAPTILAADRVRRRVGERRPTMTAAPGPAASGRGPGEAAPSPASQPTAFDPVASLDGLLSDVGLSRIEAGASVSFAGQDPIVPAAHRLGACIGVPLMAGAVAAVALHRHRGGPAQDLHLDLRQAVHTINPGAFWHPTLSGEDAPHPLVLDNPFLVTPYRTMDGRWVMASAVYPHLVAAWCRFLDVPPDAARVAAAVGAWDAFELEEAASARGLPICVVRTPAEWRAHEQGAWLAAEPVIGMEQIGDAPVRDFGVAERPFDGLRVLSFTHAVAGPTVGRTLAEQGADVLCATRPNDYEHEFIYAEANVGSRSAYLDLDTTTGEERAARLLDHADVVVNNHRSGALERRGLDPRQLAERYPGLVSVSITCYGERGPWAGRGGFDMNGSAASGLMTIEGSKAEPRLPVTALLNDYITGYLGAIGTMAALVRRATVGGSWHVTVSLTRTAMWCGSLGLVDPALAGTDEAHSLREPLPYDAPSPLGDVHMLAPPVRFSRTPPAWPTPVLVPRGSSRAEWRAAPALGA